MDFWQWESKQDDTGERGRLSYVLWEEAYIMPILALEVISEKYNGEYEGKLADYQTLRHSLLCHLQSLER
jgi:Uma2 family endonuclease